MLAYVTPDDGGGVYLCRRFRFRAELASAITGTLRTLVDESAWEEIGNLTPAQMASFADEMFESYLSSGDTCMIGTVFAYITENPPTGSLALDGTTYNVADYPLLAANLDPVFDNGDGTFTLPDTRGRTIIGAGTGTGLTARAVGDTMGVESVALGQTEMPEHFHNYRQPITELSAVLGEITGIGFAYEEGAETSTEGGGLPHENMQPSIALKEAVWYR